MSGPKAWGGQAAFAGILAGLALGLSALALAGGWAIAEIAAQAGKYRAYKALQAGAGKADSLSAAYAAVQRDLKSLRSALPAGNPGAAVLDRLVQEARTCSLSIAGISALDEIPFPGYRELPYEMEVAGGFKDLVRYLHALESGGAALQVRAMSLRAESMNKSRIKAKLGISAFAPGAEAGPPPDTGADPAREGAP